MHMHIRISICIVCIVWLCNLQNIQQLQTYYLDLLGNSNLMNWTIGASI